MRILVADDHDLVRETIAAFLHTEECGEVHAVSTLDEAIDAARQTGSYDLVLLDYHMPGMNGLAGLTRMREANTGKPVAILSGCASPDVAKEALKAGAQGFVPKTISARSLLTATRFMAAGEIFAPFEFLNQPDRNSANPLSDRERDVLRGIGEGKSNKEIARDCDLPEVSVKLHVKTLSRKLCARNRTHAAMIARDRGLT